VSSRRFTLDDTPFAGLTGAAVRVAVIDSGVHPANPHIGGAPVSGVRIGADGALDEDFFDRIGHGTAVAAAILEKAPGIELVAVRVFDRTLATSGEVLARAITWAAEHGARVINLSLGTANPARAARLGAAVDDAVAAGAIVVSARESAGVQWLPGSLPNVVGVTLDTSGDRNEIVATFDDAARTLEVAASGYPRPIPSVPVERNLSGISFAVANVTGFMARLLEHDERLTVASDLARILRANA
jgi:subtilisin family serine protease